VADEDWLFTPWESDDWMVTVSPDLTELPRVLEIVSVVDWPTPRVDGLALIDILPAEALVKMTWAAFVDSCQLDPSNATK
jgi:hypothetical protein